MITVTRQPALIGEYRVLDLLGEGGMGRVYRAIHTTGHHVVAIKVMNMPAAGGRENERAAARARNEAEIQSGLRHQNIVRLYEYLEWEGQPCLVMEYLDGSSLAEQIRAFGPLPVERAMKIFGEVVAAIDYLHRHHILHRDIKASNIRITAGGEVKLLDFGIARADSTPKLTQTGMVIGTLEYLSPEQLGEGRADERSDIWALGIMLYEMLTGRAPFEAKSLGTLITQINNSDYIPPSTLNAGVPREVGKLIARCLKKRPADRYSSAAELLAEVGQVAQGPGGNPPSPGVRRQWFPASLRQAQFLGQQMRAHPRRSLLLLLPVIVLLLIIAGGMARFFWPEDPNLHTIRIETPDGPAEMYRNRSYACTTPCEIRARTGEKVELEFRREGLIWKDGFTATDNRSNYASYSR
jgi:serine/threonine-protein kinase